MQYTIADAATMLGLSVRHTSRLVMTLGLGLRLSGGAGIKPIAILLSDSDIAAIRNRNAITEEARD